MKTKSTYWLISLLLIQLLAGCANPPAVTSLPPSPTLVLPATNMPVAPSPTGTSVMTSTPTLPPLSAPTAIYDENVGVQAKCVKVNQNLQSGSLGTGVAVLESRKTGPNHRYQRGFFFLNMETGNLINLLGKNDNFGDTSVSPDRTLLSANYITFDNGDMIVKEELFLISSDGEIQKALPWDKDWVRIAMWIDNQQFIIDTAGSNLLALNPFTGEQYTLATPAFPNRYDGPWGYDPVVYNPSLTRAIYLAEPGRVYVLWDMQKKKALLDWVNISQKPPLWSPDGSKLLIRVADPSDNPGPFPDGLYLVDNDGTVLLPALSDIYAGTKISITDYFWSPSGQFVALLANAFDRSTGEYTQKLLVLDIQTRQIMDYCVEFTPPYNGDPTLIWSPDETQILLNDKYDQNHNMRVILVDLAKGTAFPIAEDMVATGWMKSP